MPMIRTAKGQAETLRPATAWVVFPSALWVLLTVGSLLLGPASAQAEHADIDLRIITPNDEVRAGSDQAPPPGGVKKPPVMTVPADQRLVLQFFLTNAYPHGKLEDVVVRYYVVPTDELGRKPAPSPKKKAVTQGRMVMDFKPKCRVGARLHFRIPKPGLYTVRVETGHTQSDHEHFSALDLKVK